LPVGRQTITINGNGNNTIAAGSGFDTVAITGNGNSTINPGTGTISLTIAGSGILDITGAANIAATGATIGNGSTLELGGSCSGVGPICFAAGGTNETLKIDGTMPSNLITGFALGDTIDLAGVDFSAAGSAQLLPGNVLSGERRRASRTQGGRRHTYIKGCRVPRSSGVDGQPTSPKRRKLG
jgi:hypothetical protein